MYQAKVARKTLCLGACIGLLVATFSACSTVKVWQDYDPDVDLSALRAYKWLENEPPNTGDPRVDNELLWSRIRVAIDKKLATQGFVSNDTAPDFIVSYHVGIDQKIRVDSFYTTYPGYGRRGYGRGRGGYGREEIRVTEYDEGSLVIDFLRPESGEILWRGVGTSRLREVKTPEEREAVIQEVVDKVLGQLATS